MNTLSTIVLFTLVQLQIIGSRSEACDASQYNFLIISIDNAASDRAIRLKNSAENYELGIIFLNPDANVDDISGNKLKKGGSYKRFINDLKLHRSETNLGVLVIDGLDVVINANKETIICQFIGATENGEILFPAQSNTVNRFPNSALFMGTIPKILMFLETMDLDSQHDQIFYSNIYAETKYREKFAIEFDGKSRLFQNVDNADREISLQFSDAGDAYIHNILRDTNPSVIFGSQDGYVFLNYLGNYIGRAWSAESGCALCSSVGTSLNGLPEKDWPMVTMGLFITKPIPFVPEFLTSISNMAYPASKIDLYVYNNQKYSENNVKEFVKKAKKLYRSVEYDNNDDELGETEGRRSVFSLASKASSDFIFMLNADVHLENSDSLRLLIETSTNANRGIVAPLVTFQQKLFSNFWGALNADDFYARSEDYIEIIEGKRIGTWNVPYVTGALLIDSKKFHEISSGYERKLQLDPDMRFCEFARAHKHFLYVDNQRYYGFLVDSEDFAANIHHMHPEMYDVFRNRNLWEKRYVHPEYFTAFDGTSEIEEPCPDVYHYPLMSETFTKELIEEMVDYGKWSGGENKDDRLSGGYENVPTVDIHMNQIGFEKAWLHFLDEYVRPMQEKIFIGYYQKPVESLMMFVVRYRIDEQSSLPAHHDSSTYTVDIALNKRGVDYEGGGVRFVRYNCTVLADAIGYAAMFPGRLTHLHEGLPVVSGTRYIAVSFLNP